MHSRALIYLLIPACYSPTLAPCVVQCGEHYACPGGMFCLGDGHCHASADESFCGDLNASGTPDAVPGTPDAAPGTPDADGGVTSSFSVETVATNARSSTIAVDAAGGVHIAYLLLDADNTVKYAYKAPGGSFQSETVDSPGVYGSPPAIAVDGDGVHIGYCGGAYVLYAFRPPSGGWDIQVVDVPDECHESAIAVASGEIHVGYTSAGNNPVDDFWLGSRWGNASFDSGVVEYEAFFPYLITDAAGELYFGYTSYDAGPHAQVSFWSRMLSGSGWWEEILDYPGSNASFAIDAARSIHAAYAADCLRYAHRLGLGDWAYECIDTGGSAPSIGVDAAGGLHVAYWTSGSVDVNYAYRAPGSGVWMRQTVNDGGVPGDPYLAVDPAGGVHITYADADVNEVRYAYYGP